MDENQTRMASHSDLRGRIARGALIPAAVMLHFAGAVMISMVIGFFPESLIGERWYHDTPLQAFAPVMCAIAVLLAILLARSLADKRAIWAWIPGLLWFGFGVYDMLFVHGVLQTGAWAGSTPFRYLLDNLFGGPSKCGDTECLYEVFLTMPLAISVAYSVASWITLRHARKSPRVLNHQP